MYICPVASDGTSNPADSRQRFSRSFRHRLPRQPTLHSAQPRDRHVSVDCGHFQSKHGKNRRAWESLRAQAEQQGLGYDQCTAVTTTPPRAPDASAARSRGTKGLYWRYWAQTEGYNRGKQPNNPAIKVDGYSTQSAQPSARQG